MTIWSTRQGHNDRVRVGPAETNLRRRTGTWPGWEGCGNNKFWTFSWKSEWIVMTWHSSRTKCLRQNVTDKMSRTKCYVDKMSLDKMSRKKCRRQNYVDKMSWSKCRGQNVGDTNVGDKMSWSICSGQNVLVKMLPVLSCIKWADSCNSCCTKTE